MLNFLSEFTESLTSLSIVTPAISSLLLVLAAEIGDKSQVVCMMLAARYTAKPVFLGASFAFILLNTLAVLFGATLSSFIPQVWLSGSVSLLFLLFAYHALSHQEPEDTESIRVSYKHVLGATFLMITLAEFGDKTQLAVVALSTSYTPIAVWIGATLALIISAALGIWFGRTILQRIPMRLVHKISGYLFLVMAVMAIYHTIEILLA